jgi:phage terminase large subunit-like protein
VTLVAPDEVLVAGRPMSEWVAALNEAEDPDVLDAILAALETELHASGRWTPQDYQRPPPGNWWTWVFSAGAGTGKMLDVTTPIPTPSGWAKLGDLSVGDEVFDESGRICRITAVFDGLPDKAWRLRFSDGSSMDACGDHQWVTWSYAERKSYLRNGLETDQTRFPDAWPAWPAWRARRKQGALVDQARAAEALARAASGVSLRRVERETGVSRHLLTRWRRNGGWSDDRPVVETGVGPRVRTTAEIVETLTVRRGESANHAIPLAGALQLPEAELPVDPYVLGYWLGDGCSADGKFTCHADDQPNLIAELERAGFGPHLTPRHDGQTVSTYGLATKLRALGVLGAKHVPVAYLRGSAEQRLALLAGLMDSDGYAGRSSVEFSSTSRALADAVVELARSLGQRPVLAQERARIYGRDCGPKYRVTWRPTIQVFRLARKAERWVPAATQQLRNHHRLIVAAEPIDPTPMRCLSVDSPHRMYLAGEAMIPTHNTDAGAWWMDEHMKGPPCDPRLPGGHKAVICGPTFGDAVTTCWGHPAGIRAHNPDVRLIGRKEGTVAVWPNGAEGLFCGLHSDQDAQLLRARAANCCAWWVDEAALARHLQTAMDLIQMRARSGVSPRGIVTSTPKPTPGWKYLIRLPDVVVTHASSYQNKYLSATHKRRLDRFRGTRLEKQEIHGLLVDDFDGALLTREAIARDRILDPEILSLPPLERKARLGIVRVAVGVDPSTWIPDIGEESPSEDEYVGGAGIETGIVVVGIDARPQPHVYVLEDVSGRLEATEWARRACDAYHRWEATWVVPERNAGGGMCLATIKLTDPDVVVYRDPGSKKPGVHARDGKRARAEPVALLYDQHRAHHVGEFPALENTWAGWDPTENWSPDRLDAHVWAVTATAPWRDASPMRSTRDAYRNKSVMSR